MNLKRRLEDLKERIGTDRESLEDAVTREVIRRMSTEELKEYTDALKRLIQSREGNQQKKTPRYGTAERSFTRR